MKHCSAYKDGWFAQKNGVNDGENPYNGRTRSYSNGEWLRGWRERFNAVKYSSLQEIFQMDVSISFED